DGLHRLEAGQRVRRGPTLLGDGVADLAVCHRLDTGGDEADFAGPELRHRHALGREHADALDRMRGAGRHHADLHTRLEHAVLDAHKDHDAEIRVVPAIDEQRLERRRGVALGRRQALNQRFQHLIDIEPGLGRDLDGVRRVEADHVLDLLAHALRLGRRQVDLVEHRHDRLIDIGQGLRLDALAGIDHQERALARRQGAADLVGEINMARRVHEVEDVAFAILRRVVEAHGLRLDGDATLALDLHAVEHLCTHLALLEPAAELDEAVGKGRFAVVDMGDDRKIADMGEIGHDAMKRSGRKIKVPAREAQRKAAPGAAAHRRAVRAAAVIDWARRTPQIVAMAEVSRHHRLARRRLLDDTAATVVAVPARGAWAAFAATPRQTAGPFYPRTLPLDSDNDLARVTGHAQDAAGTITHISGRILDLDGEPVADAKVEIWQCDSHGRYHHVYDHNRAPLDPDFQGYGVAVSARDGGYRFRTIRPVPYPGRTPH